MPHRTTTGLPWKCLLLALSVCALSVGCSSGPRNFENENDRLRAQNLELEKQVAQLEQRLELRVAQIDTMEQQLGNLADDGAAIGVSAQDIPRVVTLKFARYTGAVDLDGDGNDDVIRMYVHTLDQEGRFVPVAAKANVQVVALEPGHEPVVLAQREFPPAEFGEAYRSGLTGTHYTLEVPLPKKLPKNLNQATVTLELIDGATGARKTVQQVVPIKTK